MTTLETFEEDLRNHDWHYQMCDDFKRWKILGNSHTSLNASFNSLINSGFETEAINLYQQYYPGPPGASLRKIG